jgi:hypothetical protein
LELHVLQARSEYDFDPTFAKLVELRARARRKDGRGIAKPAFDPDQWLIPIR